MELRHLRYFVAVAEELNISRAAKRLRISQPPLSRQIHDLEDEIGAALFDRSNQKVRLTAAGKYFHQEAKRILWHTLRAARLAKAAASGRSGQITIALLSPLGGVFYPTSCAHFSGSFP